MELPNNRMTISLAEQLTGVKWGNPLVDSMCAAVTLEARRLVELENVGFNTGTRFSVRYLSRHAQENLPFLLVSTTTSAVYRVFII